jgi:hypothetical protein
MQLRHFINTFFLLLLLPLVHFGQIGGESTYEFLSLSPSARYTAQGGAYITVKDDDPSLAFGNPSVLNPSMHNRVSLSTVAYPGGINYGTASYARYNGKFTWHTGIQYITYGKMQRTDPNGSVLGQFGANEIAGFYGMAYEVEKYSFGGNAKLIYSNLDGNISTGMGIDLAANYTDTAKMFSASLVLKNIGFQFNSHTGGPREPLPFDVQIGISKRLKYLPFRFSMIVHNFYRWDIRYDDPALANNGGLLGQDTLSSGGAGDFFDNFFRHFIFAGEFYFGKSFRVGFAYNHMRRQELAVQYQNYKRGFAGFSFGFGFDIKQFEINYGFAKTHVATGVHHFTLNINLDAFMH